MAKIINDSLITSKPNAPLDVRTEVATLADVVNISNPSESLVFKVLETGKYYKVDSLKVVQIEGTTLTKKVVESFSPVGDVEEAPKDGSKYYRQNGVWVKIDESIDPALPILMINLKSDRGSDDTIERLKFTVKYASVVTELESGQRINVPYGARLVVEFPSVEGYNKPDDIVVEDVSGNVVRNAVYEYTVTEVNVYVSAEDGTTVDGQIVTVNESGTSNEYEVLGGKVSFTATKGNEVSVSINKKEGDYGTPESVTFVADGTTKNISMMYAKLLIDTIYINNMTADTDSIISGEVNGKAVQAIWNNTKRCLGKIVINESSEEELVLLEIDQNDNRYYKDGSLIDLEGLSTNAYFFTVIPSFAYKISQMQGNIYKVEILYNYKRDEEGWKNFDELVVPTFALSNYESNNYKPIYYKSAEPSYKVQQAAKGLTCVKRFDIFDYSNIVLLILAKYGASRNWDNLEQISMGVYTEGDRIIALSGYSLRAGTKDAAFFAEGGLKKAYSFLGIENLLYRSLNLDVESFVDLHFNDTDSCGIQCNSDGTLTLRGNDKSFTTDFSYTESGTYVKSLLIRDYFFAVYERPTSSSDLYYKDSTDNIVSGKCYTVKNMLGVSGSTSSSGHASHIKISCPCRIEREISNFNKLENIWV